MISLTRAKQEQFCFLYGKVLILFLFTDSTLVELLYFQPPSNVIVDSSRASVSVLGKSVWLSIWLHHKYKLPSSPPLSFRTFIWESWNTNAHYEHNTNARVFSCIHGTHGTMKQFFFCSERGDIFLRRWHHGPSPEEHRQAVENALWVWRAEYDTSGPQRLYPRVPDSHWPTNPCH